MLYFSPITRSPAYPLELRREPRIATPYNWGLDFERRSQPFEDQISRWLGPFTAAELVAQFRAMGRQWAAGLSILRGCLPATGGHSELRRQYAVAAAARLKWLSTANVIEFLMRRDALPSLSSARQRTTLARMRLIVCNDLALAREMKRHLATDGFIGFHSEMLAYSYSKELLEAKIRQGQGTLRTLTRWIRTGIPSNLLSTTLQLKAPEQFAKLSFGPGKTYKTSCRNWLKWGD
ncbi:MAG: hypothetical protein HY360_16490 [Verrucomicrobia bacterium]|nr:hypothetical protein [Verrucomicrobiota bacterium]